MWVTNKQPNVPATYRIKTPGISTGESWSRWSGKLWYSYCKDKSNADATSSVSETQDKTWWLDEEARAMGIYEVRASDGSWDKLTPPYYAKWLGGYWSTVSNIFDLVARYDTPREGSTPLEVVRGPLTEPTPKMAARRTGLYQVQRTDVGHQWGGPGRERVYAYWNGKQWMSGCVTTESARITKTTQVGTIEVVAGPLDEQEKEGADDWVTDHVNPTQAGIYTVYNKVNPEYSHFNGVNWGSIKETRDKAAHCQMGMHNYMLCWKKNSRSDPPQKRLQPGVYQVKRADGQPWAGSQTKFSRWKEGPNWGGICESAYDAFQTTGFSVWKLQDLIVLAGPIHHYPMPTAQIVHGPSIGPSRLARAKRAKTRVLLTT